MKYTNFKLKLRACLAVLVLFVFAAAVNAQQTSISGIVKDAGNGEPILGANVLVKGTTNGTITNFNGEFTLSVPSDATLVIRFVGYLPVEIAVAGKKNIVVELKEDVVMLGEVVAIGYGTVKKNDVTGSVTAIKPDKMNRGLTTNAQDMMTGKIAGVSVISKSGAPGAGADIRIRGGSSLSASNDPLIVIDGLAMDNDGIKGVSNFLSTINPNDIESFTILKDASATAIYGSRASNGVIIINTKRGVKDSKPRISYDGNVSVSNVTKKLDVLTGDEFRAYVGTLYADQPDVLAKLGTANTDWQSQIYRTAISHDHNINITGGFKNLPYRVSAGYTNQEGVVKTSNFERYTGAISLNPSLFDDHLKINLNAKGMFVKNRYIDGGVVGNASSMDPTQPVTSNEAVYQDEFGGYFQWYNTDVKDGVTTNSFNSLASRNPVALLNQRKETSDANDFIGSAEFDYKFHFLPELRAHLNLGMESSNGQQDLYVMKTAATDHPYGRSGWDKQDKTNKSLNYYMQYAKELGNHNFDLMAGYEWQHFARNGSHDWQGLEKNILNPLTNELEGYNRDRIKTKTESYLVSFFGRVNYSYANKYLLTATLRQDGTSRFSSDNRWGLFPAAALAWKINEESFLKDKGTFSDLKLRVGYGVTGQQNINQGDYPYIPVYTINQSGAYYPIGGEYLTTYRPDAYNSSLKWEETTTWNAGLDMGIMNNRITGSLDYYFRETKDLLNIVDVPAGTNFSNRVISNIGSLQNQGVEFAVNAKAISNKDCTWDINYNITYNNNKITKLTTGSSENYIVALGGIGSGTGNNVQAHSVGYPAKSYYVYEQVYDNAGKAIEGLFVDRNGDGVINDDDRYFYHNPAADIMMGISSKIVYKNFDLGISLRASFGNYVYNDVDAARANVGTSGVWSTSKFFSNRPVSALNTNFVGKTNYYFSDYYVQNASFLRCDNITMGYSFKNLFKVISSGRIYATVQNPFVITNYEGLDPEISEGIDNNIYPRPMVSMIGISLNF